MNEFEERYKSLETIQLLRIIEEPESYQPNAIEAAHSELEKREVNSEDVQLVKEELSSKKLKNSKRQQQIKNIKTEGSKIMDTLNPIQSETPNTDKKINWIAIVFGIYSIYLIASEFDMMGYMGADLSIDTFIYFLGIFIIPVGVFFFWRRKKLGWFLMSVFFIHNTLNFLILFFFTVEWNKPAQVETEDAGGLLFIMEDLFPQPSPFEYFLLALFYGATFWVMNKKDIRDKFLIDKKAAMNTILITSVLTIFLITTML